MFSLRHLIALPFFLFIGDALAASQSATTPAFAHLSSLQQKEIDELEHRTFDYFRDSSSQKNGLAPDHWLELHHHILNRSAVTTGCRIVAVCVGRLKRRNYEFATHRRREHASYNGATDAANPNTRLAAQI